MSRRVRYPLCETPIGGTFIVLNATERNRIAVLSSARTKAIRVTTKLVNNLLQVRRLA